MDRVHGRGDGPGNRAFRMQFNVSLHPDFVDEENRRRAAMRGIGEDVVPVVAVPQIITVKYGGRNPSQTPEEAIALIPSIIADRCNFRLQPGDVVTIPSGNGFAQLSRDSFDYQVQTLQRRGVEDLTIPAVFRRYEIPETKKRDRTRIGRLAAAKRRKSGGAKFVAYNVHLITTAECLQDNVILEIRPGERSDVESFNKCARLFSIAFSYLLKKKTHGETRDELVARFTRLPIEKRKAIWGKCVLKQPTLPKGRILSAALEEFLLDDISPILEFDGQGAVVQQEPVEVE